MMQHAVEASISVPIFVLARAFLLLHRVEYSGSRSFHRGGEPRMARHESLEAAYRSARAIPLAILIATPSEQ
jgi:hypothetical protein